LLFVYTRTFSSLLSLGPDAEHEEDAYFDELRQLERRPGRSFVSEKSLCSSSPAVIEFRHAVTSDALSFPWLLDRGNAGGALPCLVGAFTAASDSSTAD
tara:strand:+ start:313 stop:609 length:297 start_codon:yes stop_codon:yes gene_type:complete